MEPLKAVEIAVPCLIRHIEQLRAELHTFLNIHVQYGAERAFISAARLESVQHCAVFLKNLDVILNAVSAHFVGLDIMLGSGDSEITLDRHRFRNGFGDFFERFVEVRKLSRQAVPRGNYLLQSGQRGVAGVVQELLQSVFVRLDHLLIVFVGLKERAAPFSGVFVEVLIPQLSKFGIVFFLRDLVGFQLKFKLGFFFGVCRFPGGNGFGGCLFRGFFGFLICFFLLLKALFVCLFLLLG